MDKDFSDKIKWFEEHPYAEFYGQDDTLFETDILSILNLYRNKEAKIYAGYKAITVYIDLSFMNDFLEIYNRFPEKIKKAFYSKINLLCKIERMDNNIENFCTSLNYLLKSATNNIIDLGNIDEKAGDIRKGKNDVIDFNLYSFWALDDDTKLVVNVKNKNIPNEIKTIDEYLKFTGENKEKPTTIIKEPTKFNKFAKARIIKDV